MKEVQVGWLVGFKLKKVMMWGKVFIGGRQIGKCLLEVAKLGVKKKPKELKFLGLGWV
jgi:hypothetical protein